MAITQAKGHRLQQAWHRLHVVTLRGGEDHTAYVDDYDNAKSEVIAAALAQQERAQKNDHSAGLIHQTIPDMDGTEPRMACPNTKVCREPCEDVDGLNYCMKCGLWEGAK